MNTSPNGTKVYVYGLLDLEGNITYIGKSSSPRIRLSGHVSYGHCESRKLKIIDSFYDTEFYHIQQHIKNGYELFNKSITPYVEEWEIGDIVELNELKRIRCKNILTNKVYQTIQEVCDDLGLSSYMVKQLLKTPNHKLKSTYPIELL